MLKVEVSDTGTGVVYLRDGENSIIVSPSQIPDLLAQLAKGLDDFRSNIEWKYTL